jgi:hypothetical protein
MPRPSPVPGSWRTHALWVGHRHHSLPSHILVLSLRWSGGPSYFHDMSLLLVALVLGFTCPLLIGWRPFDIFVIFASRAVIFSSSAEGASHSFFSLRIGKLQTEIALSTCEAEYIVASQAMWALLPLWDTLETITMIMETAWSRNLFQWSWSTLPERKIRKSYKNSILSSTINDATCSNEMVPNHRYVSKGYAISCTASNC